MITNNFCQRLGTTLMGMLITNVFFAHRTFNSAVAEFKEELGKLAYRLMHNPFAPDPAAAPSPQTGRGSPGSPASGSPTPDGAHPLLQLSKFNKANNIEKKTAQLRCVVCGKKTSWYCSACTTGPFNMVPVCPCSTRGGGKGGRGSKEHACEGHHCLHPGFRLTKRKNSKRARLDPDDPFLAGESDAEDEDD